MKILASEMAWYELFDRLLDAAEERHGRHKHIYFMEMLGLQVYLMSYS